MLAMENNVVSHSLGAAQQVMIEMNRHNYVTKQKTKDVCTEVLHLENSIYTPEHSLSLA